MNFVCNTCGGNLIIEEGTSFAECDHCFRRQPLPRFLDDNLQNLFNRAINLRLRCEFDKAEELFEKIIQAKPTEPEAYWNLILCKYGIEYVDDPVTFKKIPTCHRASYDSIVADDDYKAVLENADMSQRAVYEEQAKEIDGIQREILALARDEEPYDVFICYKETDEGGRRTHDSVIANDIYYQLTEEGFKVFYAPITLEDRLGSEYEPIIFAAINSAKVMLAVGTKPEYFNSVWVKNEWSRFLKIIKKDRSKLLIPCYRDMDAYDLPAEFARLQAQDMSKIGFIKDVARGIKKVIKKEEPKTTTVVKETVVSNANADVTSVSKQDDKQSFNGKKTYANGAVYEGEIKEGKRNGKGKMTYANGDVYEGYWKDDKRNGKGKITYASGHVYEGDWKDDSACGYGKFTIENGIVYEGYWKDDNPNGKGKMILANGDVHEGEYKDGKPNGKGKTILVNGDVYEGEFKDGLKCGYGKYTWKDGCVYEGEFKDNNINGKGKRTYANGDVYEGELIGDVRCGYGKYTCKDGVWGHEVLYEGDWKDDVRCGYGKFTSEDGEVYEGDWKDDVRCGYGKYKSEDGDVYEGYWKDDKQNGKGKMTWADGDVYEGDWKDDRFDGKGKMTWADGDVYEGDWKRDWRCGEGKMTYANRDVYEGAWKDGLFHGYGKYTWENGDVYEGEYEYGKRNGMGKMTYANGDVYEGEWKKDKRCDKQISIKKVFAKLFSKS